MNKALVGEVWEYCYPHSSCNGEQWEIIDSENTPGVWGVVVREACDGHVLDGHVLGSKNGITVDGYRHRWKLVEDSFVSWARKVCKEANVNELQ